MRKYVGIGILILLGVVLWSTGEAGVSNDKEKKMKPLTEKEAAVIVDKGTEAPFTGEYWNMRGKGTYVCRQCGQDLYRSSDKFESECGWPSFDDAIPGAVRRQRDADGRREEIVCSRCGGHLGHVFEGERFTPKNRRYCVNSISMVFVPEAPMKETAYFAGGCFWGVEDAFLHEEGVLEVTSGYMGGTTENPTYDEVRTGTTGHAETVRVEFDPGKVSYETLARTFFEIHDPTEKDRQGPDVGSQYRSAIFYTTEEQQETAKKLVELLKGKGWEVVTQRAPAPTFYPAEAYHQKYSQRTGRGGCHLRKPRFEKGPESIYRLGSSS